MIIQYNLKKSNYRSMKIYIMAKREILRKASKKKNDEFFTLYNDVANEVSL